MLGSSRCKLELVCASGQDMVAPGWQEHKGIMHSGRTESLLIEEECAKPEDEVAYTKRGQFASGR